MHVHIFQNEEIEGPAFIEEWANENSHQLSYSRFFQDFTIPELSEVDLLVILGGPMNIYEEDRYPWLVAEKKFINDYIQISGKTLGICLGAQLVADSLGSKVYKNDETEIGWHPICKRLDANDSWLQSLPEKITPFHWHGETFDLPKTATKLFLSEATKNQGFVFNKRVYGLQFHLESRPEDVDAMINKFSNDIRVSEFVQSAEKIRDENHRFDVNKNMIFSLLDHISKI